MAISKEMKKVFKANNIIKNHMIWSMGAGFIPVPFADILGIGAVQLDMIRQLSNVYEKDFKDTQGKAIIVSLTGSSLARISASTIKFVPGVGAALGGVTLAIMSAASTYALGEVFKKHFETGGTFLDFDPERLRKYYNDKFEKGKEIARKLRKEKENGEDVTSEDGQGAEPSRDDIDRLQELNNLYQDKIITKAEFNKLKKKIIDS